MMQRILLSVLLMVAAIVLGILAIVGASGPAQAGYVFGLIGNDGQHLAKERQAGVEAKLLELSWREWYPREGEEDTAYVRGKKEELARLRAEGFAVILSLGYHDTPPWVHQNYRDTRYVDQFGNEYAGTGPVDNGDANLVHNDELRGLVDSYMRDVFSELGTDLHAVRLGGGRFGELTYPPASYGGRDNLYWSYDESARAESPVPGWRPGDPSPNGEAERFLEWHLSELADYQNWQVGSLRGAGYGGRAMMLYPSWGMRPGQAEEAAASGLGGATPAERNGEVQRGFDFARQVGSISDPRVVVTTTWLDADAAYDDGDDPRYWSPVKYLASLAREHPMDLELYGENTGQGDVAAMELSAQRMRRHGLTGMLWYRESEMFSGRYATLQDYERVIASYNK